MSRYVILAQSDVTARALGAWLELLGETPVESAEGDGRLKDPRCIVWQDRPTDLEGFRAIRAKLEDAVGQNHAIPRWEVTVLVDHVRAESLDPIAESGWDCIVAMLILAFPEFRWVFGVISGGEDSFRGRHGLVTLFRPHADPLFDGFGLREHVRRKAREKRLASYLPERGSVALSIDDEESYAYFHAYAAYRFGYRAQPITLEAVALDLLGKDAAEPSKNFGGGVALAIEDVFVNFPDHSKGRVGDDRHLSVLEERDEVLQQLRAAERRIFVTTGQRRKGDEIRWRKNRAFRAHLWRNRPSGMLVYKPVAGIFSLWEEAGLMRRRPEAHRPGFAPGFRWPPEDSEEGTQIGHSAPGKLLEIASCLITRAERILKDGRTVEDSVQGAVLATDALELLGDRTPTTALEALSLKHHLEVRAACQFYGVQFHVTIRPRLREVHHEIRHLSRWFNRRCRDEAALSAEIGIVSGLAGIFREAAEFDEEHECLNRVRILQRRIWFRKRPWYYPFYPLAWYVDYLLSSIPAFAGAITVWVVGLTLLFGAIEDVAERHPAEPPARTEGVAIVPSHGVTDRSTPRLKIQLWESGSSRSDAVSLDSKPDSFEQAFVSFLGAEPFASVHWAWRALTFLAAVAGLAHLGIFISHLYAIVSRK